MKIFSKLFVISASVSAKPAEAVNSCSDGIHSHETECNKFYQCNAGHRYPDQVCPEGLLFNGEVCDWPENVDCQTDACSDGK